VQEVPPPVQQVRQARRRSATPIRTRD